ncbi:hypothetical protein M1384_03540 [Candidatus Parvarchaeota archaeon]|jgi:hypothetical protein|nr:hypothetical protein [Candidatus Parvarchaeota archaeon]
MALFKKKKEEPVNPYYNESNLKPVAPESTTQNVNQQEAAQPAQNSVTQPVQTEQQQKASHSIPLIPVPSVKIPDINLQPVRSAGISVLDALRLESNSKSIAFIKMSDFKKVLDDIKELEKRITQSQADLESYSRALDTQREYVKNYNLLIQDMRKMVERMSTYLSNVEE